MGIIFCTGPGLGLPTVSCMDVLLELDTALNRSVTLLKTTWPAHERKKFSGFWGCFHVLYPIAHARLCFCTQPCLRSLTRSIDFKQ